MQNRISGKNIVLGITGSIAAFKVAGWVSNLAKDGAVVTTILTKSAEQFITPLTFQALSHQPVYTDMFLNDSVENSMVHIEVGQEADIFVIAPATANCLAKLANGLADDLLTTTALVTKAPVLIFPAMNQAMYSHPITQRNIALLREAGYLVIEPDTGKMACNDIGKGRLVEWNVAIEEILKQLTPQDLTGKNILVTAGATREPIDPARFISNRSSGKMGYALAQTAWRRGADVTLVSGKSALCLPYGVKSTVVETAEQMYETVKENAKVADIIVKAAAVSDFRPLKVHNHKVKKENAGNVLELTRTKDILSDLGKTKRDGQLLIGFAAETQNLNKEAQKKFENKNLDLIAVNDISKEYSGFATDTNKVTLLDASGVTELPLTTKEHTADLLWDYVVENPSNML